MKTAGFAGVTGELPCIDALLTVVTGQGGTRDLQGVLGRLLVLLLAPLLLSVLLPRLGDVLAEPQAGLRVAGRGSLLVLGVDPRHRPFPGLVRGVLLHRHGDLLVALGDLGVGEVVVVGVEATGAAVDELAALLAEVPLRGPGELVEGGTVVVRVGAQTFQGTQYEGLGVAAGVGVLVGVPALGKTHPADHQQVVETRIAHALVRALGQVVAELEEVDLPVDDQRPTALGRVLDDGVQLLLAQTGRIDEGEGHVGPFAERPARLPVRHGEPDHQELFHEPVVVVRQLPAVRYACRQGRHRGGCDGGVQAARGGAGRGGR
ncbi:hypothetical protein [Streptomyces sp. NPDC054771]